MRSLFNTRLSPSLPSLFTMLAAFSLGLVLVACDSLDSDNGNDELLERPGANPDYTVTVTTDKQQPIQLVGLCDHSIFPQGSIFQLDVTITKTNAEAVVPSFLYINPDFELPGARDTQLQFVYESFDEATARTCSNFPPQSSPEVKVGLGPNEMSRTFTFFVVGNAITDTRRVRVAYGYYEEFIEVIFNSGSDTDFSVQTVGNLGVSGPDGNLYYLEGLPSGPSFDLQYESFVRDDLGFPVARVNVVDAIFFGDVTDGCLSGGCGLQNFQSQPLDSGVRFTYLPPALGVGERSRVSSVRFSAESLAQGNPAAEVVRVNTEEIEARIIRRSDIDPTAQGNEFIVRALGAITRQPVPNLDVALVLTSSAGGYSLSATNVSTDANGEATFFVEVDAATIVAGASTSVTIQGTYNLISVQNCNDCTTGFPARNIEKTTPFATFNLSNILPRTLTVNGVADGGTINVPVQAGIATPQILSVSLASISGMAGANVPVNVRVPGVNQTFFVPGQTLPACPGQSQAETYNNFFAASIPDCADPLLCQSGCTSSTGTMSFQYLPLDPGQQRTVEISIFNQDANMVETFVYILNFIQQTP